MISSKQEGHQGRRDPVVDHGSEAHAKEDIGENLMKNKGSVTTNG